MRLLGGHLTTSPQVARPQTLAPAYAFEAAAEYLALTRLAMSRRNPYIYYSALVAACRFGFWRSMMVLEESGATALHRNGSGPYLTVETSIHKLGRTYDLMALLTLLDICVYTQHIGFYSGKSNPIAKALSAGWTEPPWWSTFLLNAALRNICLTIETRPDPSYTEWVTPVLTRLQGSLAPDQVGIRFTTQIITHILEVVTGTAGPKWLPDGLHCDFCGWRTLRLKLPRYIAHQTRALIAAPV
jgi:hypothetical protein